MSLICIRMKIISISKAAHLTSFWYRGPRKLGNCLSPNWKYFHLSSDFLYLTHKINLVNWICIWLLGLKGMIVVVSFDALFSHVKVLQNNQSVEWLWNFRRKTHTQRRKEWMLWSRALYMGHLHTLVLVGYWVFRNSRSLWKSNIKGIALPN